MYQLHRRGIAGRKPNGLLPRDSDPKQGTGTRLLAALIAVSYLSYGPARAPGPRAARLAFKAYHWQATFQSCCLRSQDSSSKQTSRVWGGPRGGVLAVVSLGNSLTSQATQSWDGPHCNVPPAEQNSSPGVSSRQHHQELQLLLPTSTSHSLKEKNCPNALCSEVCTFWCKTTTLAKLDTKSPFPVHHKACYL